MNVVADEGLALDSPTPPAGRVGRYRVWCDAWLAGPQDLASARLLLTRCSESLAWLRTVMCDEIAATLAAAYNAFPELWIDMPPQALADRIAAEPAGGGGHEQMLSNQIVAQHLDPDPARTLSVLLAGAQIMQPALYIRDLEAWLATSPPQAQVTRLLRRLAGADQSVDMLDYAGRLAAYGVGRRSISGDIVAKFGQMLINGQDADGASLPGGEAFVRARKAVEAATLIPAQANHDTPASLSATIARLRSLLAAGGYDATRPVSQRPSRVIDASSWIGGWTEYLADGKAFLRASYFRTGEAKLSPDKGSVRAEGQPPYRLTGGPDIQLHPGHYRLRFIGQVETPSLIHFEARCFTGKKGEHTMASVTREVSPARIDGEIAVLEFVLSEIAVHVKYQTNVLAANGSVVLAGVEITKTKV